MLAAAATGFWVAYDDGSYGLLSRTTLAVVVWWVLILATALRLVEFPALRHGLVPAAALALLAAWTLASIAWSPSAETAFDEFNRAMLYVGVLVIASLVRGRRARESLVDALTLAVAGIALVGLGSRLFPSALGTRELEEFLPAAATRLSFPLGYWNGLAISVALGIPLLLRWSILARGLVTRAAAVALLPVVGCVIFLASSRGGVATGMVGAACFVVCTTRRGAAVAALCAGGLGTAVSVAVLLDRKQLVNGPIGSAAAHHQGRSATILITLSCIGVGALFAAASRLPGSRAPALPARGIVLAFAAALIVLVVVAHPIRRFDEFRALPQQPIATDDFARAHLTSGNGSGRWQFWTSAVEEWRRDPVHGGGAGSFEQWWAQHSTFSYFVRDAHSVYAETLGELGLVGLGLLALFVAASLLMGIRAVLRTASGGRVTAAALFALFVAYLVAAGVDWMWELTAVTALGVAALGLLLGLSEPAAPMAGSGRRTRAPATAALIVSGAAVIVAQAVPMLTQVQISSSQEAVARGDLHSATTYALRARALQPWAASPYLQLALTAELDGRLRDARRWIRSAIARDEEDWHLWLVAARIETKLGTPESADVSLRRARSLNPRSPLFIGIGGRHT